MPDKGKLYLLPNVLSEGHYETIPPVAREAIAGLSHFLVENVRTSRRFISGLGLGIDISRLHFDVVDKNTSPVEIDRLMEPLRQGISIGVMSESGSPGIADPGARIVAKAHQHGIEVIPFPGPSSIYLALMASGFNGQRFSFHGYLPIDKKDRIRALRALEAESQREKVTQLFIETPYRNEQMLKAILTACAPATKLCVARDLTGQNEWVYSGTIQEWKQIRVDLHKVPAVFLIYSA